MEAVVINRELEKGRSCESRARFLAARRGPCRASLFVSYSARDQLTSPHCTYGIHVLVCDPHRL